MGIIAAPENRVGAFMVHVQVIVRYARLPLRIRTDDFVKCEACLGRQDTQKGFRLISSQLSNVDLPLINFSRAIEAFDQPIGTCFLAAQWNRLLLPSLIRIPRTIAQYARTFKSSTPTPPPSATAPPLRSR